MEDKQEGQFPIEWTRIEIEANAAREIYLEGVSFPLLLAKQVFTNEDGIRPALSIWSQAIPP
ncbi:MAG: hypothetical protein WKF84_06130 [Pyrinomonadaceae bacterium]